MCGVLRTEMNLLSLRRGALYWAQVELQELSDLRKMEI